MRERGAEDHAGQVFPEEGIPGCQDGPATAAGSGGRSDDPVVGCRPVPPVPCPKGTAGKFRFLPRSIGP